MYDSDTIPWLLVLVDGLVGEVPVRPVGAPEKSELLDEAVKVVREKTVMVVSQISDYSTTPSSTDIFIFKAFSYILSLACSYPHSHFYAPLIKDL